VDENRRRGRGQPEFELIDAGAFAESRYFDVLVEYAKGSPEDVLVRISVTNHALETASIDMLPTVWFRNTWSWGNDDGPRPVMRANGAGMDIEHHVLGTRRLECDGADELLFTENETNTRRLFGGPNRTAFVKDGINDYIVHGEAGDCASACRASACSTSIARLRIGAGRRTSITRR
jgi:hypothetical protein